MVNVCRNQYQTMPSPCRHILWFFIMACLASCSSLKPLEYRSLNNFSVAGFTTKPEVTFDLSFYNPNPIGAKLKDFNVAVELNGIRLTELGLVKASHAEAQSLFTVPVKVSTSLEQLSAFIPSGIEMFSSGSSIPLHLSGSVTVKKFIFHKSFPFDVQETLDTKKIKLGK